MNSRCSPWYKTNFMIYKAFVIAFIKEVIRDRGAIYHVKIDDCINKLIYSLSNSCLSRNMLASEQYTIHTENSVQERTMVCHKTKQSIMILQQYTTW